MSAAIFKASEIIKYVDGWSEGWGDGQICDRASVKECWCYARGSGYTSVHCKFLQLFSV